MDEHDTPTSPRSEPSPRADGQASPRSEPRRSADEPDYREALQHALRAANIVSPTGVEQRGFSTLSNDTYREWSTPTLQYAPASQIEADGPPVDPYKMALQAVLGAILDGLRFGNWPRDTTGSNPAAKTPMRSHATPPSPTRPPRTRSEVMEALKLPATNPPGSHEVGEILDLIAPDPWGQATATDPNRAPGPIRPSDVTMPGIPLDQWDGENHR